MCANKVKYPLEYSSTLKTGYLIFQGFLHVKNVVVEPASPSQLNYAVYIDPFFPGKYSDEGYSFDSTKNFQAAKQARRACDQSVSLLLGHTTSLGTLKAIKTIINEKGTNRMIGVCCLYDATNSEFFWYNVN